VPPICQLQCCCTYFCASCAARAQWSVIGARGDGTAAEDPRESDRARHGCLQTSPRAPKRQADRWAQSTVAGCQRPTRALSRGQRSRAAGAYRSGLHDGKPRCGAVVVGRPPGQCPGLAAGRSAASQRAAGELRVRRERRVRTDTDCGAERYAAEAPCGGATGRIWARAARGKLRCWPSARRAAAACPRAAASVRI
jgi:hypothetical protein